MKTEEKVFLVGDTLSILNITKEWRKRQLAEPFTLVKIQSPAPIPM